MHLLKMMKDFLTLIPLVVLFFTCEKPRTAIHIHLENLPSDAKSLYLCTVVNGQIKATMINSSLENFTLELPLPEHFSETLDFFFAIEGEDGCSNTIAEQQIKLTEGIGKASVPLHSLGSTPACRLVVERQGLGKGEVIVTPTVTNPVCGGQVYFVPQGAQASIEARTGPNSHFAGWEGACADSSTSICSLGRIERSASVTAQFHLGICTSPSFCWEHPLPQGHPLTSVWGPPNKNEVWTVGRNGLVLRKNEAGWVWMDAGIKEDLASISGSDDTNIWVVGSRGLIRHFNGQTWEALPGSNVTNESLQDVFGQFPDVVWMVGDKSAVVRGTKLDRGWTDWKLVPPNLLAAKDYSRIFGLTKNEIFATDTTGEIFQGNGLAWVMNPIATCPGKILGLWGLDQSGISKLWLTGEQGAIFHETGKTCTRVASLGDSSFVSIFGTSADTIWAVGEKGTIAGKTAGTWQTVTSPVKTALSGVWGQSQQGFYAVGDQGVILQNQGGAWKYDEGTQDPEQILPRVSLNAIAGSDEKHLRIVGNDGLILHWTGIRWQMELNPDPNKRSLYGLWSDEKEGLAVGDQGVILHREEGKGWEIIASPSQKPLYAIIKGTRVQPEIPVLDKNEHFMTAGEKDTYLADSPPKPAIIWSKNLTRKTDWSQVTPNSSHERFYTLWTDGTSFCAGGDTRATETNVLCSGTFGSSPLAFQDTPERQTTSIYTLFGTGPSDLWAAGTGYVFHRKGGNGGSPADWELIKTAAGEKYRAGCRVGDVVWLVGDQGIIRRYGISGKVWTEVPSGITSDLHGIWCNQKGTVLIVGDKGTILRNRIP